ncbi:MAG: glycosyltransferase family 2 protein [Candidatus Omnitrophica bacterium]|nr:glycosyltransferase family 2 protein [Candidatus Omnitrophota bacterium]
MPVKNEEATLEKIINEAKGYCDEILVIDGDSKDSSREIAEKLNCRVFLDGGKGKGEAVRIAIQKASGEIIVFLDADGSHEVKDIPKLVKPIKKDEADLVIASRRLGGSDELYGNFDRLIRRLGSSTITSFINIRFKVRLTDSQNGFRAIRRDVARQLDLKENIFTIEQEMVMKCLKKGFRIREINSHEYSRKFGKSRINVLTMAPRYIVCLIKNLF